MQVLHIAYRDRLRKELGLPPPTPRLGDRPNRLDRRGGRLRVARHPRLCYEQLWLGPVRIGRCS
jgi:hypothetical protein